MQDRVKDVEDKMQRESKKSKDRVIEVEREFSDKERSLNERIKREMNTLISE